MEFDSFICKVQRDCVYPTEDLERTLSRTELGRYLVEAAKHDPETDSAIEAAYQEGQMAERERQIAIDRVGSEEALKAANMLTAALVKAREGR